MNFSLENIPFLNSFSPSKEYYMVCDNSFLAALTLKFCVGNDPASVTSAVIGSLSSQVPALLQLKLWNRIRPGARGKECLDFYINGDS